MHINKSSLRDTLTSTVRTVEHTVEDVLYDKWHIRLHKRAKHHIHKLRKRPDHHKDIISFLVAFVCTSIVFIGWYFISFPKILATYEVAKKESTAVGEITNPLYNIKDKITNIEPAEDVQ
jgi:hypothetical protein